MVNNPIYPGYKWKQAFDFPEDFFQVGDYVRAEFRHFVTDPLVLVSISGDPAARIDGNRLYIELNEEQTISVSQRGTRVITNFVVVRDDVEIPIGQIISIPIVSLPTRPNK